MVEHLIVQEIVVPAYVAELPSVCWVAANVLMLVQLWVLPHSALLHKVQTKQQ